MNGAQGDGLLSQVLYDLGRLMKAGAAHRAQLAALSPTEAEVLRVIARRPGSGITAVARELGLAESNTSSAVSRLESLGQVVKERDARDQRAVRLFPSEDALANIGLIESLQESVVSEALSGLPEADSARIQKALPALRALRDRLRSGPPAATEIDRMKERQPR